MAFQDKFPLDLEFEIDRKRLVRYYRFQSLVLCMAVTIPAAVLVACGFLKSFLEMQPKFNVLQRIVYSAGFVGGGVFAGFLLAMAFYYGYFRRSSQLAADNLRLRVEGPYLRMVSGSYLIVDRRYHFKDIHTYTTCQGPFLKRFGMKTLMFHVSIRQMSPVLIDGVTEVDSVRDRLCEIDAAREMS